MMTTMKDIPIVSIIFDENATVSDLLQLVSFIAIFWAAFFYLFGLAVRPLIRGRQWLADAGSRDYDRGGKEMHEALGCPKTREEFIVNFENQWPWAQAVFLQHFLGGMLCVPAILNFGDPHVQSSLACLSILSEMGWEIEDLLGWIWQRWFTPGGKIKAPLGLIIFLAIHHSLTTILGLPMVLHYRTLRTLHWLTFDLQFAGAVSLMVTEYTKLLDVTNPRQLRQFQILTGFALLVMVVTRLLHWTWLCGQMWITWYEAKAWTFLAVGVMVSILFSGFNWLFCIQPFYARFVKFLKVSAEYQSLPASANAEDRRASIVSLNDAAANLMVQRDDIQRELAELMMLTSLSNKKLRRVTMPPTLQSIRRPSSTVLLRSSLGDFSITMNQLRATGLFKED